MTGGETPLGRRDPGRTAGRDPVPPEGDVLLAVLTDGRATGAPDAFDRALEAAAAVRRAGVRSIVLDCESGGRPLGLAGVVAEAMGAACVRADDLRAGSHASVITAYAG